MWFEGEVMDQVDRTQLKLERAERRGDAVAALVWDKVIDRLLLAETGRKSV